MSEISFELPIRSPAAARSTTAWLTLGLISLVAAGFFSILLVLARTPFVQEYIPFRNASAGQQATALLKTLLNQPGLHGIGNF